MPDPVPGTHEVFLRLLRGEATTQEYVDAVRRKAERDRTELRRARRRGFWLGVLDGFTDPLGTLRRKWRRDA